MHPARLPLEKLAEQCKTTRLRRSGPGGQHRNKVETAVQITHTPTGVTAEANERRSQAQNQAVAWQRLRVRLAVECRTPADECQADYPSQLWRERRRGTKVSVNTEHQDFPALLAEAVDVLAAADWDDARAAEQLEVSRTQFVRLLQSEPLAMEQLNRVRRERGQSELR